MALRPCMATPFRDPLPHRPTTPFSCRLNQYPAFVRFIDPILPTSSNRPRCYRKSIQTMKIYRSPPPQQQKQQHHHQRASVSRPTTCSVHRTRHAASLNPDRRHSSPTGCSSSSSSGCSYRRTMIALLRCTACRAPDRTRPDAADKLPVPVGDDVIT